MTSKPSAIRIDLRVLDKHAGGGPQWGHESEDLDLTLLAWSGEQQVPAHTNNEVDVLMIAVAGRGQIRVGGDEYELVPGEALLIPKGVERSIRCAAESFAYLSVHRRRRGLWPTLGGQPVG